MGIRVHCMVSAFGHVESPIVKISSILFFRERYGKEVGEYRKRVVMLEEWVKTLRLALNTQTEEVRMSERGIAGQS